MFNPMLRKKILPAFVAASLLLPGIANAAVDTDSTEMAIEAGDNTQPAASTAAPVAPTRTETTAPVQNKPVETAVAPEKNKDNASPAAQLLTLPNPIHAYETLDALQADLGFMPLTMPEDLGLTPTARLRIDATLADLRYTGPQPQNAKQVQQTFCLRSAKRTDWSETDISGIYSVNWWPEAIHRTNVFFATNDTGAQAARWGNAHYLFSVEAAGMTDTDFHALVTRLTQITEANYTY